MIFRRKKPSVAPGGEPPVIRGRDSAERNSNPLARRFHPEDEPDTIDLQQPAGFNEEPATAGSVTSSAQSTPASPEYLSVVNMVAETGKLYVQPGQGDSAVYLGDEAVRAPTELRQGDCIRVGAFKLQILPE